MYRGGEGAGDPLVLINPELAETSAETQTILEGCTSVPEQLFDIARPREIMVRALNRDGEPFEVEADGMLAQVIQHEIEHLQGKLLINHLSKLKRDLALKKAKKLRDMRLGNS
ncbi:peptide deformylase [Streptomyces xanthochromogenes]|uniref:peptide deformylase n=1 Tax=Streptomyces xanthochromogenes TaxID=67384 RepID=UPI003445892A